MNSFHLHPDSFELFRSVRQTVWSFVMLWWFYFCVFGEHSVDVLTEAETRSRLFRASSAILRALTPLKNPWRGPGSLKRGGERDRRGTSSLSPSLRWIITPVRPSKPRRNWRSLRYEGCPLLFLPDRRDNAKTVSLNPGHLIWHRRSGRLRMRSGGRRLPASARGRLQPRFICSPLPASFTPLLPSSVSRSLCCERVAFVGGTKARLHQAGLGSLLFIIFTITFGAASGSRSP